MGSRAVAVRALMPEDGVAVRALVTDAFGGTRYLTRWLEVIEAALAFEDPEYLALVACDGVELRGVAAFGTVTGADRVVKLHGVVVRDPADSVGIAALLDAVARACEPSGERMIVCELPGEAVFERVRCALLDAGYVAEGRVPDLVAEGISLLLLAKRP